MLVSSTVRWWYAVGLVLLLAVGLVACFEPAGVVCRTGLKICPAGTICSVDGESCTTQNGCGNGRLDPGETCDDGNQTDGDHCSADCKSDESCGNGIIDRSFGPGDSRNEVCDDHNTENKDGCSADCKSNERCGNGIIDFSVDEVCDDGNQTSGDGCSANCKSNETCGNHVIDLIKGEQCDDGNNLDGDGCTADCKNERCGNNVRDPGEACDDGNTVSGDGCRADCLSNETCGNGGMPDTAVGEVCDDGNRDGGDGCSADCRSLEECGNGIIDRAVKPDGGFEICDDGNRDAGDGCSADCKSTEVCGNGIVDVAVGEVCDDGNRVGGDGCSANCRSDETCGNRLVDLTKRDGGVEQCDDGPAGSPRCSPFCVLRVCGNGITDLSVGEVCDDGNTVSGDGCSADCRSDEKCGNNIVDVKEECDDGNSSSTDGCIACRKAYCGDGFVQTGVEACDTKVMTAACNADCTTPRCGDGIVNPFRGEQCDVAGNFGIGPDGGTLGGESSTCDRDCTVAYCGDGVKNALNHEECDDGNTSNTDGCTNACTTATCGDGFMQGAEQCDDGNRVTEGCAYGTGSCRVCDDGCHLVTVVAPSCGDGFWQADAGEACDDGNTSACGTCSATCAGVQPKRSASGFLVAVAQTLVHDGDYFVLDDGVSPPVTFEFDTAILPTVSPGRVRIDPVGLLPDGGTGTADDVAKNIRAAIASVSSLSITALPGAGPGVVTLGNTALGGFGNRPILWSGTTPGFQVSGMSDGAALDCGPGVGCTSNEDCLGALQCRDAGTPPLMKCQP